MKKILIGTNNPSKLRRIKDHLAGLAIECVSPAELGLSINAPENARDAIGNAYEKALAWHEASGLPVMTEDSGLLLLDLPSDHPDQPGVHVRRVAGHEMTDDEMIEWYSAVARRHGGKLRAVWQDAWCILADKKRYVFHIDDPEKSAGWIFLLTDTPCEARHPGWPLDSLSLGIHNGKYKAEMTIADMDSSFTNETTNGAEQRERLKQWMRDSISAMIL